MTTPTYDWWLKALKLAGDCGALSRAQMIDLVVDENSPQPGFYRKKVQGGLAIPVAIWVEGDQLVALAGGSVADAFKLWTWACPYPISEATYRAVIAGEPWPGLDEAVAAQIADRRNSDPANENEVIRDQIESAKAGADKYAKIEDDETAAKAQSLRSRILELKGDAERKHQVEKAPHLKAGRDVDAKWLPLVKEAEAAALRIRAAIKAWEDEKLRRQREEARKAEEEHRRQEEERRNAEAAASVAEPAAAPPQPAPVAAIVPASLVSVAAPAAPKAIRGAYGRAASVSVVNVVTGITDQAALYEFMKDRPEVQDLLLTLAKRAVASGRSVPGVSVDEQARVA